jgi:hypothetical protein
MPMMAITVRSSIRVKPARRRGVMENRGEIGERPFYKPQGLVEQSKRPPSRPV